ncbi:exonuclease VIII [Caballeronia peredens]|nr:exonuclease VIII [Caballeronia peredens]
MKREFIPGIVEGLDIAAYHAMEPISKSGLDSLDLSPAIFWARHRDPLRPAPKEKAGQLEGNLAHCEILEPGEFNNRYVVGPTLNRNTKAWKEFVEANAGRVAIQSDQSEAARRQAVSVWSLPDIGDVLANGMPEVSAFWIDDETGSECRCRPDWVHPVGDDKVILADVKTYSIASPGEFRRQVARKRYDVQAAYYSDGYAKASGKEVLGFIFLAVETEWPFAANAFMLDEESIESGRIKYRENLRTYAECMRTEKWPGYSTGIDIIRLPQWALITEE